MEALPDTEEVERLAYQLWIERGRPVGTPLEDWDRAERLLRFSRDGSESAQTPDLAPDAGSANGLATQAQPDDATSRPEKSRATLDGAAGPRPGDRKRARPSSQPGKKSNGSNTAAP